VCFLQFRVIVLNNFVHRLLKSRIAVRGLFSLIYGWESRACCNLALPLGDEGLPFIVIEELDLKYRVSWDLALRWGNA
jgi:hypothetical protein